MVFFSQKWKYIKNITFPKLIIVLWITVQHTIENKYMYKETNLFFFRRMKCSTSFFQVFKVNVKMADNGSSSIDRINGMCKSNVSLYHVNTIMLQKLQAMIFSKLIRIKWSTMLLNILQLDWILLFLHTR